MARIFKLAIVDPELVSSSAGIMVDREGELLAQFLQVAAWPTVLFYQQIPDMTIFPSGSVGALLRVGTANINEAFHIENFTHDAPANVEQGMIIVDVTLSWELDFSTGEVISYELTGPGTAGLVLDTHDEEGLFVTSVALTGINLGATAVWTLTANTYFGPVSDTCVLPFGFKVFSGRGGSVDLTESQVEALSNVLAVKPPWEYTFAANSGGASTEYLWIAYPEEFGPVQVFHDGLTGLPVQFQDEGSINVTNVYSIARLYRIMRSTNALNGAITLVES